MRSGVMNLTRHMLSVGSFCSSAAKATLDSECQSILVLTETEQVLLEYRCEFWFLLVLWTSCNVLFYTSLRDHSGGIYLGMNVSGDVCDEVVSHSLMSKSAAFLSKLTSVKMFRSSWCQRLRVISGVQSESKSKLCSSGRDAGHWCFGSGKAVSERGQERLCGIGQS